MEDLYHIIRTSADGAHLTVMTRAQLEKALGRQDWGERPDFSLVKAGADLDLVADEMLLIIKGTSVVPRPKTVVETWQVE